MADALSDRRTVITEAGEGDGLGICLPIVDQLGVESKPRMPLAPHHWLLSHVTARLALGVPPITACREV